MAKKQQSVTGKVDIEIIESSESLRHDFTQEELLAILKELSERQLALRQIQDDAKKEAAQWKFRIEEVNAKIAQLSNNGNNKWEYRDTAIIITLNEPVGKKTARRKDNKAVIWVKELSPSEKQKTLDLQSTEEVGEI